MLSFVNDFPGDFENRTIQGNDFSIPIPIDHFKICGKVTIDNQTVAANDQNNNTRIILDIFMLTTDENSELVDTNIAELPNCGVNKTDGHIVITLASGGAS